jgi:hypothetical protein
MMDKLVPSKERYGSAINHYEDDDFIDRLNNRWTVRALVMCIAIISGHIIGGRPINCWTPSRFI